MPVPTNMLALMWNLYITRRILTALLTTMHTVFGINISSGFTDKKKYSEWLLALWWFILLNDDGTQFDHNMEPWFVI